MVNATITILEIPREIVGIILLLKTMGSSGA